MSELCFELKGLVEWENTVIHLPAMSSTEVQIVKRNESKVDQQKQGAFDTWLRRCPGASWSHVRDALHKAGEYTMEKKIATNHSISLMFSEDPSRRRHDDTAITCPRTAVRTGSVTVAATRDPHGSHYFNPVVSRYNPTQDPLLGKMITINNISSLITFLFVSCFFHYLRSKPGTNHLFLVTRHGYMYY